MVVLASTKTLQIVSTYVITRKILVWMQSGFFFATSHGKSPCDDIGGSVKRLVTKRSLQSPLNNQILNYKSMIDLCREEMKDITFLI